MSSHPAEKAEDEVLDDLAHAYHGEKMDVAREATEKMRSRWMRYGPDASGLMERELIEDQIDLHLRRAEVHARHGEEMAQMIEEKQAEVLYWVLGELDEHWPVHVSPNGALCERPEGEHGDG